MSGSLEDTARAAARKPLLEAVRGEVAARPPVWIMRQAGRYLPEYRQVREKAGDFLSLCYSPDYAAEVTLQPLRRFDLDAAILFADILLVPDALGQHVAFEKGEGPVLDPVTTAEAIGRLSVESIDKTLGPIYETVERVKAVLPPEKTMIGFCGAPWTVATYMVAGRGTSDQAPARLLALSDPETFGRLIDMIVDASAHYLIRQFKAGADVVQIFESWALNIDEAFFARWIVGPTKRLIDKVRAEIPDAPIIGFPRGAGPLIPGYIRATGVNAVGLDYAVPLAFARDEISPLACVQGNLDPLRVVAGGRQMLERTDEILSAFEGRPHIFNLGHGIVPQTPIAHVEALIEHVKGR